MKSIHMTFNIAEIRQISSAVLLIIRFVKRNNIIRYLLRSKLIERLFLNRFAANGVSSYSLIVTGVYKVKLFKKLYTFPKLLLSTGCLCIFQIWWNYFNTLEQRNNKFSFRQKKWLSIWFSFESCTVSNYFRCMYV